LDESVESLADHLREVLPTVQGDLVAIARRVIDARP
jgi:hypothetical protein